jgi:hypothetical protein
VRAYNVSELEEGAGPKEDAVVSVFLHLQGYKDKRGLTYDDSLCIDTEVKWYVLTYPEPALRLPHVQCRLFVLLSRMGQ